MEYIYYRCKLKPFQLRNFLLDVKTFIVELVALVAGLLWARNTNWDHVPVMLMAFSAIGILIFVVLRFLDKDKPTVELKLIAKGASRSPPGIINGVSPKGANGQNVIEVGGTYLFEVCRDFHLVIQNNSKKSALNLTLYKSRDNYPVEYKSKLNSSEPLVADKPRRIELTYRVKRPMTHDDAEKILKDKIPEDIKNISFIVSYDSESRTTYYTKLIPSGINKQLQSVDLRNFEKV